MQLELKFGVALSGVLQFFDLFVEDVDLERYRYVLVISNGIAFSIASRRTRITHDHNEIIFLHAAHRNREELLRLVGDVARRVFGRLAVLSNIGAHESEIAIVARPLEVVRVAAEETDVLGRCIDNAHVAQRQISKQVIREPFVEREHARRDALGGFRIRRHQRAGFGLNRRGAIRRRHSVRNSNQHVGGDVF